MCLSVSQRRAAAVQTWFRLLWKHRPQSLRVEATKGQKRQRANRSFATERKVAEFPLSRGVGCIVPEGQYTGHVS